MKNRGCLFLLCAICMVLVNARQVQAQDNWTFMLIPANGQISGTPGLTIGWGYTITNNSQLWLFPSDLQANTPFLHGVATILFPNSLAPKSSVTIPYTQAGTGLVNLTWDNNAPVGFTDAGIFQLTGYYYDGDPFNGGQYVADAGTQTASYQATVITSAAVPEPSSKAFLGAMALGSGGLLFGAWRQSRRFKA